MLSISQGSVTADTSVSGYPYVGTLSVPSIKATDSPVVIADPSTADVLSEHCESIDGGIRLWFRNNTFGTVKIKSVTY